MTTVRHLYLAKLVACNVFNSSKSLLSVSFDIDTLALIMSSYF